MKYFLKAEFIMGTWKAVIREVETGRRVDEELFLRHADIGRAIDYMQDHGYRPLREFSDVNDLVEWYQETCADDGVYANEPTQEQAKVSNQDRPQPSVAYSQAYAERF